MHDKLFIGLFLGLFFAVIGISFGFLLWGDTYEKEIIEHRCGGLLMTNEERLFLIETRLMKIMERLEKLESNQAYLLNAANRADMYTLPIGGVSEGFTDNSKSYDEYFRELRRED